MGVARRAIARDQVRGCGKANARLVGDRRSPARRRRTSSNAGYWPQECSTAVDAFASWRSWLKRRCCRTRLDRMARCAELGDERSADIPGRPSDELSTSRLDHAAPGRNERMADSRRTLAGSPGAPCRARRPACFPTKRMAIGVPKTSLTARANIHRGRALGGEGRHQDRPSTRASGARRGACHERHPSRLALMRVLPERRACSSANWSAHRLRSARRLRRSRRPEVQVRVFLADAVPRALRTGQPKPPHHGRETCKASPRDDVGGWAQRRQHLLRRSLSSYVITVPLTARDRRPPTPRARRACCRGRRFACR